MKNARKVTQRKMSKILMPLATKEERYGHDIMSAPWAAITNTSVREVVFRNLSRPLVLEAIKQEA